MSYFVSFARSPMDQTNRRHAWSRFATRRDCDAPNQLTTAAQMAAAAAMIALMSAVSMS